jgi:hypothetical protein
MGGECSMLRDEKYLQNFVAKSEGKKSLGRPKHGWKDRYNIRMELR